MPLKAERVGAGFAWSSPAQYGYVSSASSAGSMATSCRPGTWGTCAMSAGGLAAGLIPGFGLSSRIMTPLRAFLSFTWGLGGNFGSYDDYCREMGRWVS